MNLNPFSSAKTRAEADVSRLEDGLASRILDLSQLDAKIAGLQVELSQSIEAGRNTDALEASIAQCSMTAAGKNVAVRAASDAVVRARKRLDDAAHAEAVERAKKGLEPRQLTLQRTEARFAELVSELFAAAALHERAADEERELLARLSRFGEKVSPVARNLSDIVKTATATTAWANGPGAVETVVTVSVRGNDSPALDSLFP